MSEMKEINTLDLLSDLILISNTFNNLTYKAELTMNDLMTTRTQGIIGLIANLNILAKLILKASEGDVETTLKTVNTVTLKVSVAY